MHKLFYKPRTLDLSTRYLCKPLVPYLQARLRLHHQPRLARPLLRLLILLALGLELLHLLAALLAGKLVGATDGNILWFVIREEELESLFDNVAGDKVAGHDGGDHDFEFGGEGHEFEFLVDFGNEFGRAREGDGGYGYETPVHALVFAD